MQDRLLNDTLQTLLPWLQHAWPHLTAALSLLVNLLATAHVVLHKRDVRAALGFVGLIWFAPILGAVFYLLFGVNRIRRRGAALPFSDLALSSPADTFALPPGALERSPSRPSGDLPASVRRLSDLVDRVTHRRLTLGNAVEPLLNGDEAYPRMLEAIETAERSIGLATYIFDNDAVGRRFAEALAAVTRRGVQVRVLVDAVGARYSFPSIFRVLARDHVPAARFLPTTLPWRMPYMNLRLHRKLLVVDGRTAFTGGMNIRAGHLLGSAPRHPTQDLHFRLTGPIVGQLAETFAEDWLFATGEVLRGPIWFPALDAQGPVLARAIRDGPDHDFEQLKWTLLGAIACAERHVRILTPYFIPDEALITTLNTAAMRGVSVEILLPSRNNLKLVQWASMATLWQVLRHGVKVWLTPPPFDHSKLLLIDGSWVLLGSANLDPRSLRLNFELNVECYDQNFAARLTAITDAKMREARRVTLSDVDSRPLAIRLRDGLARLLSPYL
ncbi:MAG: cardiolipin synthase [Deltaproteobacteria bacterium]|nr:MAG: cardiolipin synthase [Deltaproteobacteria bacterium]